MNSKYLTHIDTGIRASEEVRRVAALNGPIILQNRKIRAANKKLEPGQAKTPLLKVPYKEPQWVLNFFLGESKNKMLLEKRVDVVWERAIEKLSEPVKSRAACIVWWDYIGSRSGASKCLREYVKNKVVQVPDDKLSRALYACGYTPYAAWRRVTKGDE